MLVFNCSQIEKEGGVCTTPHHSWINPFFERCIVLRVRADGSLLWKTHSSSSPCGSFQRSVFQALIWDDAMREILNNVPSLLQMLLVSFLRLRTFFLFFLTTLDPLWSFFKRSWVFCTSKPIALLFLQNCNCANDVVVHDLHLSFLIASDFNQEILVQNFVTLYYLFGAIFLKSKIVTKSMSLDVHLWSFVSSSCLTLISLEVTAPIDYLRSWAQ